MAARTLIDCDGCEAKDIGGRYYRCMLSVQQDPALAATDYNRDLCADCARALRGKAVEALGTACHVEFGMTEGRAPVRAETRPPSVPDVRKEDPRSSRGRYT